MKYDHLEDMIRGWFIGDFKPNIIETSDFEVGVKRYNAGDYEARHYHKISTEVTVILNGQVEMNGKTLGDGDIITIPPGEATDFKALTNVTTVVVKVPSSKDDKYEI